MGVYFLLMGSFNPYPESYPPVHLSRLTKEDVDALLEFQTFAKMRAAKEWSEALDIPGYIEACTQMPVALTDWIGMKDDPFVQSFGLPDEIKEALKTEARRINESIRRKREEEMTEIKLNSQNPSRSTLTPETTGSYLNRVFR